MEAQKQGRIETLDSLRKRAEEIVQLIAETGQSGGFSSMAANASTKAKWWQGGTVASLVSVVGVALVAVFCPPTTETALVPYFASKIVLVFALGVLSRYSATQANRASREELYAKQRALELKALEGYLQPFPDEVRAKLREELLPKYFGVGSTLLTEVAAKDAAPTSSHDLAVELVKEFAKQIPKPNTKE